MKHNIFLLIMLLLLPLGSVLAQPQKARARGANEPAHSSSFNFEQFLDMKCNYVVGELGLTPDESARFLPIYRELQKEKSHLYHKYTGFRQVRKAVVNGEQIADTTVMRVVRNNAQLQVEDAQLEQKYIEKLSRVLTPVQLFKLQHAQKTFTTDMMKRGKPARK